LFSRGAMQNYYYNLLVHMFDYHVGTWLETKIWIKQNDGLRLKTNVHNFISLHVCVNLLVQTPCVNEINSPLSFLW
jgi:hypothetical protein